MSRCSRILEALEAYSVLLLPVVSFLLGTSDLSFKVFSLDIDLAQSVTGISFQSPILKKIGSDVQLILACRRRGGKGTYFSVVSFRSFSALSSSSSSNWTFLAKFSPVVRWDSPSSEADLSSLIFCSDLSFSSSDRASLCWSEAISWSRSKRVWLSYIADREAGGERQVRRSECDR